MIAATSFVRAPLADVYHAFYDINCWKDVLSDVVNVNVLYQDGRHQLFEMTVARPAGHETVRGIRFCSLNESLTLCQTVPPPGFSKMQGMWTFHSAEEGTRVVAQREIALVPGATLSLDDASQKLHRHLTANLEAFKCWLER